MKARAPGKLVLSGAYVVLYGAPAIVTAVDRYAEADSTRSAEFISEEVRAAFRGPQPFVDASELREDGRKLGLGSSSAILLAALATRPDVDLDSDEGKRTLFLRALRAHREAQGGGSGVDVAASCFGGTLEFRIQPAPVASRATSSKQQPRTSSTQPPLPTLTPTTPPRGSVIEVWSSPTAAVTSHFVHTVRTWGATHPSQCDQLMQRLSDGAEQVVLACRQDDTAALVQASDIQSHGLQELGERAGLPIFSEQTVQLAKLARKEGATFLPAGAGGGDISLFVGTSNSSDLLRASAVHAGLRLMQLQLGARGVHRTSA